MKTIEEKAEEYISGYGDGHAPKGVDISQNPYSEERGFTLQDGKQIFIDGAKWALDNQWISVKDKLPSNLQRCFIRFGDGTVIHSCYVGGYFMGDDDHDTKYWMPIPKLSNS